VYVFVWREDFADSKRTGQRPKCPERWLFFQLAVEVELLFLDSLCQLNALNRHGRRLEALEPEHRPDSLLYPAMILYLQDRTCTRRGKIPEVLSLSTARCEAA
jgi:hypothetical protein